MIRIKMVGFKVGKSRPVANKTIKFNLYHDDNPERTLGKKLIDVLIKSDFVSIRKIKN